MEPAVTLDGHAVEVFANIGDSAGTVNAQWSRAPKASACCALNCCSWRTRRRRTKRPRKQNIVVFFDDLGGRPLVVRTLDVGGDKPLPYWPIDKEENPFLGVRGIRLTLQRPRRSWKAQLRALAARRRQWPAAHHVPDGRQLWKSGVRRGT
jgi:phosphoenolpyruvate-protein kinase (PTS system EI component)